MLWLQTRRLIVDSSAMTKDPVAPSGPVTLAESWLPSNFPTTTRDTTTGELATFQEYVSYPIVLVISARGGIPVVSF